MIFDTVVTGKILIGIASAGATLLALRLGVLMRMGDRSFSWMALALLVANRLGLFALLMIGLHFEARSDVTVYFDEAKKVLERQVPFRDFFTAYSPLYPYVAAGPLLIWVNAKAIMLESLAIEILALPLWLLFARCTFGEHAARRATLVYCFNPLAQLVIPLAGQNHVWLSFFLAAALCLTLRRRSLMSEAASGAAFSLGTVLVKWLSLLHAPVLFMRSSRRLAFLSALLAPIAILYGFWIGHFGFRGVVSNIEFHAAHISSGNLPYYLTAFGAQLSNEYFLRTIDLLGLGALATVLLIPAVRLGRFDDRVATYMLVAITLTFLIVSKKSFTSYFVITLFPFCLLITRLGCRMLTLLPALGFLLIAAIEPALWFRWLGEASLNGVFTGAAAGRPNAALVFFAVESLLLGCYGCYASAALRAAFAAAAEPDCTAGQRETTH